MKKSLLLVVLALFVAGSVDAAEATVSKGLFSRHTGFTQKFFSSVAIDPNSKKLMELIIDKDLKHCENVNRVSISSCSKMTENGYFALMARSSVFFHDLTMSAIDSKVYRDQDALKVGLQKDVDILKAAAKSNSSLSDKKSAHAVIGKVYTKDLEKIANLILIGDEMYAYTLGVTRNDIKGIATMLSTRAITAKLDVYKAGKDKFDSLKEGKKLTDMKQMMDIARMGRIGLPGKDEMIDKGGSRLGSIAECLESAKDKKDASAGALGGGAGGGITDPAGGLVKRVGGQTGGIGGGDYGPDSTGPSGKESGVNPCAGLDYSNLSGNDLEKSQDGDKTKPHDPNNPGFAYSYKSQGDNGNEYNLQIVWSRFADGTQYVRIGKSVGENETERRISYDPEVGKSIEFDEDDHGTITDGNVIPEVVDEEIRSAEMNGATGNKIPLQDGSTPGDTGGACRVSIGGCLGLGGSADDDCSGLNTNPMIDYGPEGRSGFGCGGDGAAALMPQQRNYIYDPAPYELDSIKALKAGQLGGPGLSSSIEKVLGGSVNK